MDRDGALVIRRVEVARGDRIVFRLANTLENSTGVIRIQWQPAVRYETYCPDLAGECDSTEIRGRRVTYYVAPTDSQAERMGETLVYLGQQTTQFSAYDDKFPLTFLNDPRGPLDLELGSFDTTKKVEFDNVSCEVEFDHALDDAEPRQREVHPGQQRLSEPIGVRDYAESPRPGGPGRHSLRVLPAARRGRSGG
jgi:hypothetical protein